MRTHSQSTSTCRVKYKSTTIIYGKRTKLRKRGEDKRKIKRKYRKFFGILATKHIKFEETPKGMHNKGQYYMMAVMLMLIIVLLIWLFIVGIK